MRIVAVAALDPFSVHAALKERPVYVNLSKNLSVRVVEIFPGQRFGNEVIQKRFPHPIVCTDLSSPRMTPRAGVDLVSCGCSREFHDEATPARI